MKYQALFFGRGPGWVKLLYAYAYPEPTGFSKYPVQPKGAYYNSVISCQETESKTAVSLSAGHETDR